MRSWPTSQRRYCYISVNYFCWLAPTHRFTKTCRNSRHLLWLPFTSPCRLYDRGWFGWFPRRHTLPFKQQGLSKTGNSPCCTADKGWTHCRQLCFLRDKVCAGNFHHLSLTGQGGVV